MPTSKKKSKPRLTQTGGYNPEPTTTTRKKKQPKSNQQKTGDNKQVVLRYLRGSTN